MTHTTPMYPMYPCMPLLRAPQLTFVYDSIMPQSPTVIANYDRLRVSWMDRYPQPIVMFTTDCVESRFNVDIASDYEVPTKRDRA